MNDPFEESLEMIPARQSSSALEVDDNISTISNSNQNIDSLRLVRSRSNTSSFSGTGYLFLAVVFCMMCCSSLITTPSNQIILAS